MVWVTVVCHAPFGSYLFPPSVLKVQLHILRAPMRCECSRGAKQHSNTNQMCEHLHSSTVKFCEGLSY